MATSTAGPTGRGEHGERATTGTGEHGESTSAGDGTVTPMLDGLQGLLGVAMLVSGGTKLAGLDRHVESFEQWVYPQWFRVLTGGIEAAGGLGLLAGRRRPSAAVVGGGLVSGTMLGAVYTHLVRAPDPPSVAARPVAPFALAALLTARGWRRRGTNGPGSGLERRES
jgi:uncharacterized membrane protein YphA (DoxX/SURF4 family)